MATTRPIYEYRIFCNTENKYLTLFSEVAPTVCPTDCTHSIDATQTTRTGQLPNNALPLTSFDEVRVAERTRVIELKSIFGKSTLRDKFVEAGTATITNAVGDSEYHLQTSGAADEAWLRSAERGRYVAGLQGEVGIAVRVPQALTGNQAVRIGLFDENNGFYFLYNSTGLHAAILRDGVQTTFPRASWNYDRFDGKGPSQYLLDQTDGIIYTIRFTWYGYGNIEFRLNTTNPENRQSSFIGHVFNPYQQTSVKTPNLPISVRLTNGGTAAPRSVFVAGRQYSLLGKYTPLIRVGSAFRVAVAINSTTSFVHVLSIRRKVGYLGNPIRAFATDVICSTDIVLQFRVQTTLAAPTWVAPNDHSAEDTAAEIDSTSTGVVTGGKPIWTSLVSGSSRGGDSTMQEVSYDLPEYDIMSIVARGVSAANGTATIVFRWTEEW